MVAAVVLVLFLGSGTVSYCGNISSRGLTARINAAFSLIVLDADRKRTPVLSKENRNAFSAVVQFGRFSVAD